VPDNTPLVLRVTPEGRAPVSVKVGAGLPLAVTVKLPDVPNVKVELLALVIAGAESTVAESVFDVAAVAWLVCTASPPPHASAVLLTDVGELEGTLTVRVTVELEPPAIPGVAEQVTTLLDPPQVHKLPEELYEASV
jgi:hypothetical protein